MNTTLTQKQRPETSESNGDQSDREKIAALAYSMWRARGCPEGSSEEDWLHAEEVVRELEQFKEPTAA